MGIFAGDEISSAFKESNAKAGPSDRTDENGLLVCGRCGTRKETIVYLNVGGNKVRKKVGCLCKCMEQERLRHEKEEARKAVEENAKRLKRASLMDERFQNARFQNAEYTQYNSRNMNICRNYVSKFGEMVEKKQGLLFWGGVGTGKSYGAACIANELMDRGIPVVMTSFVKAVDFYRTKEQEEQFIKLLASAKLVIFDDLGAERSTEFSIEKVYDIIDSRYRSGLPMIVTTNLSMNEMLQESDMRYSRIYDRIFEMCYPLQWTGPSWRKVRAKGNYDEMNGLLGGN